MSQHLTAVFEGGVFKPEQPVSLPEGARVDLQVTPRPQRPPMTPQEAMDNFLELARRIQIPPGFRFLTREELNDRARH